VTVPQEEPLLPAETTTSMPAARVFWTTVRSASGSVQPSPTVQPHELLMTCGAFVGSGFVPPEFVGAMNHSKHSL
jgi:hypothetical protein